VTRSGDLAAADLTAFGIDGGLRYVGTEDFLRRRLIGCTVDQFLARPDVEWVLDADEFADEYDDEEWELVEEDGEDEIESAEEEREAAIEAAAMLVDTSRRVVDAVRRWCFQQGITPAARLEHAVPLLLTAILPVMAMPEDGDVNPKDMPSPDDLVASLIGDRPVAEQDDLRRAMDQVHELMKQFKDPKEMLTAVGYGEG